MNLIFEAGNVFSNSITPAGSEEVPFAALAGVDCDTRGDLAEDLLCAGAAEKAPTIARRQKKLNVRMEIGAHSPSGDELQAAPNSQA